MTERAKVLITRRLPQVAHERVATAADATVYEGAGAMPREVLLGPIEGSRGAITLLTDRVDDELLDAAGPQLAIVANFAVGFDNIDLAACTRHGVMASNTPGVLTETTADTAWALMMAAARRVPEGDRFLRSRTPWIWGPLMMLGQDVHGKTLGIVGFGRIGQAVARRANGFGMRVVFNDAYPPPDDVVRELGAEPRDLDALLAESDFVSLHVNLTPETRHLIDADALAKMKPTAVLVNTSRGPVIDEAALADALEQGVIFAAGLDVFEREPEVTEKLLDLDNAVVIPHLGSATVETRDAMGMLAADNLLAALEGEPTADAAEPRGLGTARRRGRIAHHEQPWPSPSSSCATRSLIPAAPRSRSCGPRGSTFGWSTRSAASRSPTSATSPGSSCSAVRSTRTTSRRIPTCRTNSTSCARRPNAASPCWGSASAARSWRSRRARRCGRRR